MRNPTEVDSVTCPSALASRDPWEIGVARDPWEIGLARDPWEIGFAR